MLILTNIIHDIAVPHAVKDFKNTNIQTSEYHSFKLVRKQAGATKVKILWKKHSSLV